MGAGTVGGDVSWQPPQVRIEDLELRASLRDCGVTQTYEGLWQGHTRVVIEMLAGRGGMAAEALAPSRSLMAAVQEIAPLRHPNLCLFLGYCPSPPAIMTEFCEQRGSLSDVLRRARSDGAEGIGMTWRRRLGMALDAARGILYLHSQAPVPVLCHTMSSCSLLIDAAWRVKVGSCLFSRLAGQQGLQLLELSDPRCQAPEVAQQGAFSPAGDVFAFGMILYELLTWRAPWVEEHPDIARSLLAAGRRPAVPPKADLPGAETPQFAGLDAYVALMRRCWDQEPAGRPAIAAVYSDLSALLDGAPAEQPSPPPSPPALKACLICKRVAELLALLPCGHKISCSNCASDLSAGAHPCPVCGSRVSSAIRIFDC